MFTKKIINKKLVVVRGVFLFGVAILLQSCFVAKTYERPEVLDESQFRTDLLPQDSSSLGEVSWRTLFTDQQLAAYIEQGLQNNIDIRVALQQLAIADAYYKQGKSGYFPTLNVRGQVTHQELSGNSQFGALFDGSITQYELTGNLAWEADVWGKIRSTKRASEAAYLQTAAAHQAVKTQLIAHIATVYYRLLMLDAQLAIVEQTIQNRGSSLETTQALKDAGIVTEVAVKQTEAQLYTAQALQVDIKRDILLAENMFSILLGNPVQQIERGLLEEQTLNTDLNTGFPAQLLSNRPDVIAAEYRLVEAFELSNIARSNFYPSLGITATSGFQSLEIDQLLNANSIFATFVGSLVQPLINGRRIRSEFEASEARKEIAYLQFRQALLTAGREVSDAMYSYKAAEEKIEIKTNEFEAYNLATTYSEELLDSGFANFLEVLIARENTLNAEVQLTNIKFEKLQALVALYRALGGGME
jgi:multidrug efflux system outer membrane protein